MTVSTAVDTARAAALREDMVGELRDMGAIHDDRVAAAFRAVPRHLFAPGEPLERAYAAQSTLLAKRDERGAMLGTVSAPHIQALMLQQAEIEPGMRVLEIGSGGYNAALLAELVGENGEVTTVDIDPEVIDRACRCLATAGYGAVHAVLADAEGGVPEFAPYDRVIVTASAWDVPPAWREQLADGGRIVVPLRMRCLTRSVVFEADGDRLVSRGYELCSFVPMQGIGAPAERLIRIDGDDVGLRVEDGEPADDERLREALAGPRITAWSGVTGDQRFDGLHLWLALGPSGFGVVQARKEAVERGVVAHAWPLGMPAAVDSGSFAYLGLRRATPEGMTGEFGVHGHGRDAEELVERVLQRIRSWDGTSLDARITVFPAGAPDEQLPAGALVLDRPHTRIAISWP